MRQLQDILRDYDLHLLGIIANRWDVDLDTREEAEVAKILSEKMTIAEVAAAEWDRLTESERGALQAVVGSKGHKMAAAQFERIFGEIRQLGPDRRQREKPHLNPTGAAETLYYRGLLYLTFDEGKTGVQSFVFVPDDLAAVLPTHRTGYDLTETAPDEGFHYDDEAIHEPILEHVIVDTPTSIQKADTSLVDDLSTLLSYITIHPVQLEQGMIPVAAQQGIMQYFLGAKDATRLYLILFLGVDLELIDASSGQLQPVRANVRRWLEDNRIQQVKSLVTAWHQSSLYNELWHVSSLAPEEAGWRNDPTLLRQTLYEILNLVDAEAWVGVEGLIDEIKESEPDFQRPGGDYSSWYIRDRHTGDYLHGFESWDYIEGASLYFALTAPMHWLGLLDVGGEDTLNPTAFKLTVFGKAWLAQSAWPDRKDPETHITFQANGTIQIQRAASRYDRFQLARFTEWVGSGDYYSYLLNAASLKKAGQQQIKASHIKTFLQRTAGGQALPAAIQTLLDNWESAGANSASIERLVVLQLDSAEILKSLFETPEIRRFLGKQLGPTAIIVREEQWQALSEALEARGISVETDIK